MKNSEEDISNYEIKQVKITDEKIQKIVSLENQKLEEKNLKNLALKQKDKIIDFSLLNANSKIIHIKDIIDKNKYTLLNFFRGVWCPYCNKELQDLEKIKKELKILNCKILALSPQSPFYSLITKNQNRLTFEVLSDKNSTIANNFGIVFTLSDKLKNIYESFGIDLLQLNKSNTFELPFPAIFIINKNYEIIFSFVEEDYTKRAKSKDILRAIKKDIINSH